MIGDIIRSSSIELDENVVDRMVESLYLKFGNIFLESGLKETHLLDAFANERNCG